MPANVSYVCLDCRVSYKLRPYPDAGRRVCPRCAGDLLYAGSAYAAPAKRDTEGWRVLTVVLNAGLTFRQCCCGSGPGYRPRTLREVRERLDHARRTGEPVSRALERYEVP
ncbi:deoxyxylulose-5-phosphate synthase [Streptomyces sp. NPDC059597]|uniref:deoxyxylulose-5-phosphate synthase n=1 Tax=Streptomyces sp. NPDC059597 TaxID=3346879 RepID=UPI00367EFDA6